MKKPRTRFTLLCYRPIAKRWRWPAFLIVLAGIAFYRLAVVEWQLSVSRSVLAAIPAVVGAVIFIYTLLAGRAHVSCHDSHIVVHTPLYPIAFSYARMGLIRPVEFRSLFPPEKEKAARWRFYGDLWGLTVPTIELKSYPLPLWWLRMWLHPFMINPKETGLVVPVEEWISFVRRVETRQTTWREQRRKA